MDTDAAVARGDSRREHRPTRISIIAAPEPRAGAETGHRPLNVDSTLDPGRGHLAGHPGELLGVGPAAGCQCVHEGFESPAGSD